MEIKRVEQVLLITSPSSGFIETFNQALVISDREIFLFGIKIGQRILSGTTAQRPSYSDVSVGFQYFDTTLGKPIWNNGNAWVDATGTQV